MSNTPVELKGSNFTLSVVHLHDANPTLVRRALEDKIALAPAFLRYAPVVVNVNALEGPVNWQQLQQAISATGLRIIGISGCNDASLKAEIDHAGLPLLTEGKRKAARPATPEVPPQNNTPATKARLVDTPVRSGQRIYAPGCDLIVTNHVSAGAELIADGNIHIYGAMRGRALAGAGGDREAQIFSTHLSAELISIAGEYWLSDNIPAEYYGKAVRLWLADNALTVQLLT